MRFSPFLLLCVVGASAACHPGPIGNNGSMPSVGGTIAGIVRTSDSTVAVPGRKVTAVDVSTGSRYDTTTGVNGGYTIKVPEGTYRLELELRASETLGKKPQDTHINNGDLDPGRDFVITIKPNARR
jgi:hypothetical protein